MTLYDKIQETTAFITSRTKMRPKIGIILGSGLGGLTDVEKKEAEISYTDIPHFPVPTVKGHGGQLIFGSLGEKEVVLMSGRFHYYEGYSMQEVTFPVRVMKELGVETLILSNAAGGANNTFSVGDLMIITDHINLVPEHPLHGPNDDRLGSRFPDMSDAYSPELIGMAKQVAAEQGISVRTGVYVGLQGPSFETPAEYRMVHILGGDAVGMSTVPEVIVARHAGLRVFAMSIITNMGVSTTATKATHEEVLEAAGAAAPKMASLVTALIQRI